MPTENNVPADHVTAGEIVFSRSDGTVEAEFVPFDITALGPDAGCLHLTARRDGRMDLITLSVDDIDWIVRRVHEAQARLRRQSRELRRNPEVDRALAERDV